MTTPPAAQAFPTYRPREFLPAFLLGWGLGTAFAFALRALGQALISAPCEGRTLLALSAALLLGPGGLGFTAAHWRRPRRAALGLGVVVASFLPALYVGALDIGQLRGQGCAGGYIVYAPAGGGASVNTVRVPVGGQLALSARIGGFTPQSHPGLFTLQAQSNSPSVVLTLPNTTVRAGEVFPLVVSARPDAGVNTYTVAVLGTIRQEGRTVTATTTLEVNVRPADAP